VGCVSVDGKPRKVAQSQTVASARLRIRRTRDRSGGPLIPALSSSAHLGQHAARPLTLELDHPLAVKSEPLNSLG